MANTIYTVSVLLSPFLTEGTKKILDMLNVPENLRNYDAIENEYLIKFTPFANHITNAIISFKNKEDSLKIAENRRIFCQIVTELALLEKPKKDSLGAFEFPYRNGLLSLNDLLVSMIEDMCKIHQKQTQRIIDIYDKKNQQELIDIGIDYFFNDVNNGYINVMYEEGRIGDEWFSKLRRILNKISFIIYCFS